MGLRECCWLIELGRSKLIPRKRGRGRRFTNEKFMGRRGFGVEGGCWVKECGRCESAGNEWQSNTLRFMLVL
jgi:hypothetical protein